MTLPHATLEPRPGMRLGPYRLLHALGQGGMGVVWLAERADGEFEQQVAIKLVKRGMDTDAVLSRFAAERRILAQLDHPNIARLIDGGVAAGGQPWFALEYVRGEPLLTYVRRERPDLRACLELVRKLCSAVAFAHARLVVHRDLKPANVLVTADGEPKLLDFGISKLLAAEDATLTSTGESVCTPAYAAPEQIAGEPVSTATDVYALGLILFELFTGQPVARDRRQLADTTQPPSAILARTSASDVSIQADQLRGDADLIVMKALAREPSRRYTSAQALADDIERFLRGQPIAARPDSPAYRISKFVQRNRIGLAAALLVVVSLVIALATALWQARRATEAASQALAVKGFLSDLLRASEPSQAQGRQVTARELLDRSAARLDTDLRHQPAVRAELIDLMGDVYMSLGEWRRAADLRARAVKAAVDLQGAGSLEHTRTLTKLSDVRRAQSRFAEQARLLAAIDVAQRRLGRPADLDRAETLVRQARLANFLGDRKRGLALAREAVALAVSTAGRSSETYRNALYALGNSLHWRNEYAAAERAYRQRHASYLAELGAEHPQTISSLSSIGHVLADAGRFREAQAVLGEALSYSQRILGARHSITLGTASELGSVFENLGKTAEAEKLLRATLAQSARALGADHTATAHIKLYLANTVAARGRLLEAAALNQEALVAYSSRIGPRGDYAIQSRGQKAIALLELGRWEEAIPLILEALEMVNSMQSVPEIHAAFCEGHLALAYARRGELDRAEALALSSRRVLLPRQGEDYFYIWPAERALGTVELARGRPGQAARWFGGVLAKSEKQLGSSDFRTAVARWEYAQSLPESAQRSSLQAQALRVLASDPAADHPLAVMARARTSADLP